MKKLILTALATAMVFTLSACGGSTQAATPAPTPTPAPAATAAGSDDAGVTLVEVSSDQGITMLLPSDLTLQDSGAYLNEETGDGVVFSTVSAQDSPLSDWTEDTVAKTYQNHYPDAAVTSFKSGVEIGGMDAIASTVDMTTPAGDRVTIVLVIMSDGTTDYIVTLSYGCDNADSSVLNNLQASIESITIA